MHRWSASGRHLIALGLWRVSRAVVLHPVLLVKALFGFDSSKIPAQVIRRHVAPGGVLVEAGGFDGTDTVYLLELLNPRKALVVEAHPRLSGRLSETFASDSRVTVINGALGKVDGAVLKLWTFGDDSIAHGSSSLLEPALVEELHPGICFDENIEVVVRTLEALLREHNVDSVDLLWLDVQGYELASLHGLGERISSVKAIHLEVSVVGNYQGAPPESEVHQWLLNAGFHRVARRVLVSNGNSLYVRK